MSFLEKLQNLLPVKVRNGIARVSPTILTVTEMAIVGVAGYHLARIPGWEILLPALLILAYLAINVLLGRTAGEDYPSYTYMATGKLIVIMALLQLYLPAIFTLLYMIPFFGSFFTVKKDD